MPTIYLSPSTQEYNEYTGGGNEEQYMNLLADAIEPYLRSSGIQYIRNSPGGNVSQSIAQSNANRIDLHVALHSNASPESIAGQLQGTDAYYRQGSAKSRRFADLVVKNFKNIYPYPWMVDALPSDRLAEVLRTIAPAVLIEVAYHDNEEDAQWIRDNIDEMARATALSITEYFGVPLVEPTPARAGKVATSGGSLRLRTRPNTGAQVIANMPNGAAVTVYGTLPNGWYVVGYGPNVGYASGDYIVFV